MGKVDLLAMDEQELVDFMIESGESGFRGRQVYGWLMRGAPFDEMTNLQKGFREKLAERAYAGGVSIYEEYPSSIDDTVKYLFSLKGDGSPSSAGDEHLVEGVLMRYHHGDTLCLSTQVGCSMGCAFCASTIDGCARNLTAGEMMGQVLQVNRRIQAESRRVHHVVLMGSGEPFLNYDAVVRFIRLVTDRRGLDLPVRGISLSTCGITPKILDFSKEGLPVTLCISLHAPNDAIRQGIMPVAKAYPMDALLDACRVYIRETGRRVIFEYALIDGVNASLSCADELARRLRGMQCHVNLIPLNEIKERALRPPSAQAIDGFMNRLLQRNISVTRRREMGTDIQGACGQLRRRAMNENAGL